jgi:16S rRNA (guanine527-N7)-methyltransferase
MIAPDGTLAVRGEFIDALRANENAFGISLSDEQIERLADYYDLVQVHNALLHLVAPCSPEEFATRHVLESLTLIKFLPRGVRFADVGAGAGLPSIPCLIARDDLKGVLIESKEKKTKFLESAVTELGLASRAEIINRQFSETKLENVFAITSRALDKFVEKLPQLLKWAQKRELMLFGGPNLADALTQAKRNFAPHLLPLSERRYLFSVTRNIST